MRFVYFSIEIAALAMCQSRSLAIIWLFLDFGVFNVYLIVVDSFLALFDFRSFNSIRFVHSFEFQCMYVV